MLNVSCCALLTHHNCTFCIHVLQSSNGCCRWFQSIVWYMVYKRAQWLVVRWAKIRRYVWLWLWLWDVCHIHVTFNITFCPRIPWIFHAFCILTLLMMKINNNPIVPSWFMEWWKESLFGSYSIPTAWRTLAQTFIKNKWINLQFKIGHYDVIVH